MQMQAKSKALPWLDRPPLLDGSMPGDVGFDPLWVTSMLPDKGWVKFLQVLTNYLCPLFFVLLRPF